MKEILIKVFYINSNIEEIICDEWFFEDDFFKTFIKDKAFIFIKNNEIRTIKFYENKGVNK